eukprot:4752560-Amphidinium_carterae.1
MLRLHQSNPVVDNCYCWQVLIFPHGSKTQCYVSAALANFLLVIYLLFSANVTAGDEIIGVLEQPTVKKHGHVDNCAVTSSVPNEH